MLTRRKLLALLAGLPGAGLAMKVFGKKPDYGFQEAPILAALKGHPIRMEKHPLFLMKAERTFLVAERAIGKDETWWKDDALWTGKTERPEPPSPFSFEYRLTAMHNSGCRLGTCLMNTRTAEIVELVGFKSTPDGLSWVTKDFGGGGSVVRGGPPSAPAKWFVTRGRGDKPAQDILAGDEFLLLGYAGAEQDGVDLDSCECPMCQGFKDGLQIDGGGNMFSPRFAEKYDKLDPL